MRIDPLAAASVNGTGKVSGKTGEELAAPADARPDQVDLSRLSQALSGKSSEKEARLEELQRLVQSGSYEVPAPGISRKVVNFHLGNKDLS